MCRGRGRSMFSSSTIVAGRRPMTRTRSDRNAASRMLWVTKITVLRCACQMRRSSTPISSRVIASSALNGSSISRMLGSCTSARQIATRCRMPPDSWRGSRSANSSIFAMRSSSIARGSYWDRGSFSSSIGNSTFCHTVRHGSRTGLWNTTPTSRRGPATARP